MVENGAYSTTTLPVKSGNPFLNSSPLFVSGRHLKVFFFFQSVLGRDFYLLIFFFFKN